MIIRQYQSTDCQEMAELFYDTVHTINKKDYTEEQVHVWAPKDRNLEEWNRSFEEHFSLVMVDGERIVGFGDIDQTGYLDRLYVHKDYQRRGIAAAICTELEQQCAARRITVHASITARPFFEKRGYRMVKEQQVKRQGILLTNYVMDKDMETISPHIQAL